MTLFYTVFEYGRRTFRKALSKTFWGSRHLAVSVGRRDRGRRDNQSARSPTSLCNQSYSTPSPVGKPLHFLFTSTHSTLPLPIHPPFKSLRDIARHLHANFQSSNIVTFLFTKRNIKTRTSQNYYQFLIPAGEKSIYINWLVPAYWVSIEWG